MKRIISFFLVLGCLLSLFSCGNVTGTSGTNGEGKTFSLSGDYYIVRAERMADNDYIISSMNYLADAISAACGVSVNFSDDWYKKSAGLVTYDYEILIGETNRPDSVEFEKDLKVDDYGYYIKDEKVIVIGGGSPEATAKAVESFCSDVLGYEKGRAASAAPLLEVGTRFVCRVKYLYTNVTLNGSPIEDFTIAFPSETHYDTAKSLARSLASYNGYMIPIKKYSELDGSEKSVICIGASDTSGKPDRTLGEHHYRISSKKDGERLIIAIDNPYTNTLSTVVGAFSGKLTINAYGTDASLSIAEKEDVLAYTFEDSIPKWELTKESTENFYDGVTYLEQLYYDENLLPYRVYALFVDPAKASLYMGSTDDGYDYSLDGIAKQSVVGHMRAAIANGQNVIAGVNGDFFAIAEDYRPRGLTIKEGVVVGENTSRSWIGYTYDGEMVVCASSEYPEYEGKLKTAVGGQQIIVRDGEVSEIALGSDLGDTPHPRTLAGVAEDGTMIFAVIDGRQPSKSNGAPLARCALLMKDLGAKIALNLDGGGSSCMILRRGEDSFETMNSPSDGWLRRVYNSVLIVAK